MEKIRFDVDKILTITAHTPEPKYDYIQVEIKLIDLSMGFLDSGQAHTRPAVLKIPIADAYYLQNQLNMLLRENVK